MSVVTRHATYTCMDEVENAVLAGEINIGDCIGVTLNGRPVIFNVIGLDVDNLVEAGYQHSITIQTKGLLDARPFDETGYWGSNAWETSEIRQYLNGGEFEASVPALIPYLGTAKKINSSGTITEDRFFILSKEEYDPDLTPYPYYHNPLNRVKLIQSNCVPAWHWTRSARRGTANRVWYVQNTGGIHCGTRAGCANNFAPACVLIFQPKDNRG